MVELTEGKIKIDGVDVREIGLLPLRSKLGVVPQVRVLSLSRLNGRVVD